MSPKSTLRLLTASLTLAAVLTLVPPAAADGQPAGGSGNTATATGNPNPPGGSGNPPGGSGNPPGGPGPSGENRHGAGIDPNG
jgi:hypothetical protein